MLKPHRGSLILAFGILGLVSCHLFAVAAWSMANTDLREMDRGEMDQSGRELTNTGRILGLVGTVLLIVPVVVFSVIGFVWLVFAIVH